MVRTAVIIAERTHIMPGVEYTKSEVNLSLAVYLSSLVFLDTRIEQMWTVKQEDNYTRGSELLVSRTLSQAWQTEIFCLGTQHFMHRKNTILFVETQ